ncbi:MAG: trypsin-like serine peptidase [Actinoallomurus sp.]
MGCTGALRAGVTMGFLLGAVSPALPSVAAGPSREAPVREVSGIEALATELYWTPERMAAATPVEEQTVTAPRGRAVAGRAAHAFHGVPSVGVLFFTSRRARDHFCTASVVRSARRNLLLTAGHCLYRYDRDPRRAHYRSHLAFVPRYERARAPYGVWTAKHLYVPEGWARRGDVDLDFGFATLRPNRAGRDIAAVTGDNPLAPNVRLPRAVHVIGYPAVRHVAADRPVFCDTVARRRFRWQNTFACGGFYGGTSGSPWLWRYDPARRQGRVIGVVGGYHAGGWSHERSYSAGFGDDVARLRNRAERLG